MLSKIDPRLLIVLGALLFSTGGVAIKATTLTSWQVVAFRCGIAFVTLLLLVPDARRSWNWRVMPVAVAYAATMTLFTLANKLTTAASAIFLQSTAPLYLLLLSPLLLKERIARSDIGFMFLLGAGLVLFFVSAPPATQIAPAPGLGNTLGALCGVSWALTLTGLRWLAKTTDSGAAASAAMGNFLAFFCALYFALPVTQSVPLDWLIIVYLGVFQIGIAYAFVTFAMRRVSAFEASLLILVEPLFNPLWVWLIHDETIGPLAALGAAAILLATVWRAVLQRRANLID